MTSAEGYFLIAHAVNAVSFARVSVELEVASESPDGRWYTNDGREVWPFWTQPIDFPAPALPEGWLEHIQALADRLLPPPIPLAERLGIGKPSTPTQPFPRRL